MIKTHDKRPNIIVILADDWGYGDLGCYGNEEIRTPNLDKMAEQGTRFNRFYVTSPVCSPSRCSFITGQYPGRWEVHAHFARHDENDRRHMPHWLSDEAPSMPKLMQKNGYRTAHYGKWHLGGGGGIHGHPHAPTVQSYGYDDARTWNGNGPTWHETEKWPYTLHNDVDKVWAANSSRLAVESSMEFIDQVGEDDPFFINLWLKDPHLPLHPTPEQREPFAHLPEPQQTYYSVLFEADKQIGRLMDYLDENGLSDNTLVIFTSDNGPERVMPDKGTFGSVGCMRGQKHVIYDGGIRVPFLVKWPGVAQAGRVDDQHWISAVDLLPTLLEAANVKMPYHWKPDGVSALSALKNESFNRNQPMMWEWRGADLNGNDENVEGWPMLGIRINEFMYLSNPITGMEALYDTYHDEAQTKNIIKDKAKLASDLACQIEDYCQTLPGYSTRAGIA
jgi:N-acetylgalactosamine-6-sulfatase